jgi:hypothetical protein
MEMIAFKRFKNTIPKNEQGVRPVLAVNQYTQPPELITEYIKVSLADQNTLREDDGYEFLPEDLFLLELAKLDQIRVEHKLEVERLQEILDADAIQAEIAQKAEEREIVREFEEFKRWKEQKKLQKELKKNDDRN